MTWVSRPNYKAVFTDLYYKGEKFYIAGYEPVNDMLCIAKDEEKWKLVYVYYARLKNIAFMSFSKDRYRRLVKGEK